MTIDGTRSRRSRRAGSSRGKAVCSVRRGRYAILGFALLAQPFAMLEEARAQSAGEQTPLDTVVVEGRPETGIGPVDGYVARRTTTATKTDTPLIETPQSVTVITRDQMDDQSAQSVGEVLRYTAGVLGETRMSTGRYDSVFIRGFGGYGSTAGYVNYLDGLRVLRGANYLVPTTEPWGLERVEVLRGPSSVIFGQVSPGGIVNQISKRPTDYAFGEVQLQYGSFGRFQTAFDFGGPANADKTILYRFIGLGRFADTQVDHTKEQRVYLAPSITFRPNDQTNLTILASYQKDPETGFYGFLPAVGTVLPNVNGKLPTRFFPGEPGYEGYSRENLQIGYLFEHKFNDIFTVRQNLRFADMNSEVRTVALAALAADQRTATRRVLHAIEAARTFTIDNQIQADFQTGPLTHKLLAGFDVQWVDATTKLGTGTVVPKLDIFNPIYGGLPFAEPALAQTDQTQTQVGLYAQDQIKLDRWTLLAGLRVDRARSDLLTVATGAHTKKDDTATTGRLALMYNFDNGLAPYASWSTSFDPAAGVSFAGVPFEPTRGKQFEVGLKYQPPGSDLLLQASLYDLTQTNVLTTDPAHIGFQIQTGEVRSRGVELEARMKVLRNFDIVAAYAYTDVEITKSNGVDLGKRPPVVPEHMASIWGHYVFREGPLAGLALGAGVRYVGDGAGDAANTYFTPSYVLVDAMASYDFGAYNHRMKGWKLQVNARNLFDKEYVSGCYSLTGCNYGLRRTLLATLSYRW